MNIDIWRSNIIAADWRTADIDLVSLALSARYRSNGSTEVLLACGEGLGLDIDCTRQRDALGVLEREGFVQAQTGGLTDGCCFAFDRIVLIDSVQG